MLLGFAGYHMFTAKAGSVIAGGEIEVDQDVDHNTTETEGAVANILHAAVTNTSSALSKMNVTDIGKFPERVFLFGIEDFNLRFFCRMKRRK